MYLKNISDSVHTDKCLIGSEDVDVTKIVLVTEINLKIKVSLIYEYITMDKNIKLMEILNI